MRKLLVTAIASTIFLSGCATIVSESSYPVQIQSQPSNANFVIKNRSGKIVSQGITPQTVVLKAGAGYFKGEQYHITFKKQGLLEKSIQVNATVDGWYLGGNLLFGGFVGWLIVDPMTGAMYKLPETIQADLNDNTHALKIISIDTLTQEQKNKLIRIG